MAPEVAATILNVELPASTLDVNAAFRRRARLLHPDRFVDASPSEREEATREFARLNEAKETLLRLVSRGDQQQTQTSPKQSHEPQNPRPQRPAAQPVFSYPPPPRAAAGGINRTAAIAASVVAAAVGLLIIIVGIAASAGNTTGDSSASAAGLSDSNSAGGTSSDSGSNNPSATPTAAAMPDSLLNEGYSDYGNGLAWKWSTASSCALTLQEQLQRTAQSTSQCWMIDVVSYDSSQCTTGASATIETYDATKRDLGTLSNDSTSSWAPADGKLNVLQFVAFNSPAKSADLTNLACT